jgi:hypothetical protein
MPGLLHASAARMSEHSLGIDCAWYPRVFVLLPALALGASLEATELCMLCCLLTWLWCGQFCCREWQPAGLLIGERFTAARTSCQSATATVGRQHLLTVNLSYDSWHVDLMAVTAVGTGLLLPCLSLVEYSPGRC